MTRELRGRLVLVVGPSGAGKDTLIDYARHRLRTDPRIHFVRRIISRPAGAGEDHEPVEPSEFERLAHEGRFALHWRAHGLSYGIPSEINAWLESGDVVVANGSRAMLPEARRHYPQLLVVNVTAPVDILAHRLAGRGREDPESIRQRLARNDQQSVEGDDVLRMDNLASPEIAGECLLAVLIAQAGTAN
ncbi:phosphonate metabolism protein/1,5-bisphosphokinase (PRPP-forming) PhnN [Microvirga sp. VF16]|uniref:phosphonate metabolism protein/1,5-bisphosphokinase (PRPP-forming) PhnN n=1 Tax=Microvirga sp. VF16 TaxID=2807101 RepID=UPI00193E74E0|nr:phosphonate metabolism protein/1,5-bisphosphokinase (PRPP-forming) PhnN [Microvirga sp. VF16]QRM33256.1 phosphonate metabolism protein/1,5-bisphosphokinase (PRPP-forming) PhnN [Microvirga sp. VF16]